MDKKKFDHIIKTLNYTLEPITSKHGILLFESLQDEDMYKYIPTNPPKSKEDLISKFKVWENRFSPDKNETWINYAIQDNETKEYLGLLQATLIKNGNNYIAYEVIPRFWGKGIATQTMKQFIDYLFSYFDINSLKAHIDTRNTASIQLIKKLQFEQIQFLPNADFFKESNSDEYVFELSRLKWSINKKNAL
jgi:[ribosomal protein S5]-alanine N-acetyltransferase